MITHGLDLVSMLMPIDSGNTADVTQVKQFMVSFSESVEKLSETSSLLLLKTSCEVLMKCLPKEEHYKLKVAISFDTSFLTVFQTFLKVYFNFKRYLEKSKIFSNTTLYDIFKILSSDKNVMMISGSKH